VIAQVNANMFMIMTKIQRIMISLLKNKESDMFQAILNCLDLKMGFSQQINLQKY
jgi:hypothetical protein